MNTSVNEYNYRFKLTDYALFDRNRERKVAIYGRVSTEHEAQLSALENQLQWYDDQVKYHPNWSVCERYIDEGITGTQAKKRPAFLRMIEDARNGKFDLIVTREVCRFARNVVDTLVVTRELKGIGVEVFFIDDNIWTMDGDGELRLSLMATLAQEESRKTSERVKAGQKISRDNGVLYGNGNILGYDRVGDTYIINEEQAETVRIIFDLYLQGYGSMRIAKMLTEQKRKTASGIVKWNVSNIMRAIKNATYTGTKCYNKSRSNNFLEQKRINNLDMSTYEYVEGDFPAIVSQEVWDKAQKIRESRVKPSLVSTTKTTHSKRDSKDIWVNKLRCSCGSSFRKDKWHTKLDGKISYGYQCYNQINNGNKKKREALGLDTEGYCDIKMITDWKLDFMAKELLEHLWQDRKASVLIAIDLIKRYYKDERLSENQHDAVSIKAKIDKAQTRLTNLIAMRADGELSKEEYQTMRKPIDDEIQQLQEKLNQAPKDEQPKSGLELDGIISTLNTLIDFSGTKVSEEVINQFIYRVTPTSDTTFDWYVNLNGTADVRATFTAEGRKNRAVVKLEEIEQISSLHRKENEDNGMFLKNPLVFTFLHRRQLHKDRRKPFWTFTISFEEAQVFRRASGGYLRKD
ncbi:recombinase family protein [Lachnospiraceae bacterium 29-91]